MILIIANENDVSAIKVSEIVKSEGVECFIFHPDKEANEIYLELSNNNISLLLTCGKLEISLDEVESIWYRTDFVPKQINILKTDSIRKVPEMEIVNHLNDEYRVLSDFICYLINSKVKYSLGSPFKWDHNKLIHLYVAGNQKINIINSKILNTTKKHWSEIINSKRLFVTKPMSNLFTHQGTGSTYYTPVKILDKMKVASKINKYFFPSLLQEYIKSNQEIKIIFIKNQLFCCLLLSNKLNKNNIVDIKEYESNDTIYRPIECKRTLKNKIIKFMKKINLDFGILDFIIDSNGVEYFLEVNPHGEYDLISWKCKYDVNKLIAKNLCGKN